MYVIFTHVAGIALIEILFYFYYIGPVETDMLKKSMQNIVSDQENNYAIIFNIPEQNDNLDKNLKHISKKAEKERESSNKDLHDKALIYWSLFVALTILITFIELYVKNRRKKKKKIIRLKSSQEIELMEVRSRLDSATSEDGLINSQNLNILHPDNDIEELSDFRENNLILIERKKTLISVCKNTVYYIFFVLFLLAFEFVFFQYIVLNYEPLSDYELQYIIYTELVNSAQ